MINVSSEVISIVVASVIKVAGRLPDYNFSFKNYGHGFNFNYCIGILRLPPK